MSIQSSAVVVCNGCRAAGPTAASPVEAWRRARDEQRWTLRRSTAEHFCPRCSATQQTAADVERADVDAAVAEVADASRVPCTCGRPYWPDHDGGAPGPTVRHPFTPAVPQPPAP